MISLIITLPELLYIVKWVNFDRMSKFDQLIMFAESQPAGTDSAKYP